MSLPCAAPPTSVSAQRLDRCLVGLRVRDPCRAVALEALVLRAVELAELEAELPLDGSPAPHVSGLLHRVLDLAWPVPGPPQETT